MPEKRNIETHCEDCPKVTENLWADGFINLETPSVDWPANPAGKAFLCRDCFRKRSMQHPRVMPRSTMREILEPYAPERPELEGHRPRRALPAGTDEPPPELAEAVRKFIEPKGLAKKITRFLNRFLSDEALPQSVPPADMQAIQAYLAYKAYEERRAELADAILDSLKSTGAEIRAEEEIAASVECTLHDAKRALASLHRENMVYPVGLNGWAYGARPRPAGRFSR